MITNTSHDALWQLVTNYQVYPTTVAFTKADTVQAFIAQVTIAVIIEHRRKKPFHQGSVRNISNSNSHEQKMQLTPEHENDCKA